MIQRADRFHPTPDFHPEDLRDPGRRDRDRILYSSAFRRLSGITQVASADGRHPIHNRLTHTLEVAQIGRSLAEKFTQTVNQGLIMQLGGLNPEVVEAACLAHDLGHPPFGHVAEEELDALVRAKGVDDGYEGNAQTFRIINRLAVRDYSFDGLNLTRATLCAVLKYPWLHGPEEPQSKKWGAYETERAEFDWAMQFLAESGRTRSVEAEIMDWADDVAYAVHDVEDFFRAGMIPLDRLAQSESSELSWFIEAATARSKDLKQYDHDELRDRLFRLLDISPIDEPYSSSREHRARLRSFTSSLVDRYINAASLTEPDDQGSALRIDPDLQVEVWLLKSLTWHYVIESRPLITLRYGHRRLIRNLFRELYRAGKAKGGSRTNDRQVFPSFFRQRLEDDTSKDNLVRTVADLIASLTEAQVVAVHHRLTGISLGASLDPILP